MKKSAARSARPVELTLPPLALAQGSSEPPTAGGADGAAPANPQPQGSRIKALDANPYA
jgi:hypothetical protein